MIQEIMDKASQLYTGFIVAPVEYQVAIGIGVLVVIAALKNVWGILYPVRWTAASLLRVAAFLMHPRKRKKQDSPSPSTTGQGIAFDVTTKGNFVATVKSYKGKLARNLSNEQINLLIETANIYNFNTEADYHGNLGVMKYIVGEKDRRLAEEKARQQAQQATNLQNEVAKIAPEQVPFVVSEADVA